MAITSIGSDNVERLDISFPQINAGNGITEKEADLVIGIGTRCWTSSRGVLGQEGYCPRYR